VLLAKAGFALAVGSVLPHHTAAGVLRWLGCIADGSRDLAVARSWERERLAWGRGRRFGPDFFVDAKWL